MAAGRVPYCSIGKIFVFDLEDLKAWNARRLAGEFEPGAKQFSKKSVRRRV
jgi:hypothetical protein